MKTREQRIHIADETVPLEDEKLYRHMKRLLLTAGMESVEAFLTMRPEPDPVSGLTRQQMLSQMLLRFDQDSDRDDVGTSKCMHCAFRRDCKGVPNCCPCIDDRTPVHKLSFKVYDNVTTIPLEYDCGWMVFPDKSKVSVLPKDIGQYVMIRKDTVVNRTAPFSLGYCLHRAIPKPWEDFASYEERVRRAFEKIQSSDDTRMPLGKRIRNIILALGKGDDLKDVYGDDLDFFIEDYWPGKSLEEVVDMYTRKERTDDKDYLIQRRKLEKEAASNEN